MKSLLSIFVVLGSLSTSVSVEAHPIGYACVGSYIYKPDGGRDYVGSSDCANARLGGNFACVGSYLYKPDGHRDYVGSGDCSQAKLGYGYACVGSYLYKPDGSRDYVGSSACEEARLSN